MVRRVHLRRKCIGRACASNENAKQVSENKLSKNKNKSKNKSKNKNKYKNKYKVKNNTNRNRKQ